MEEQSEIDLAFSIYQAFSEEATSSSAGLIFVKKQLALPRPSRPVTACYLSLLVFCLLVPALDLHISFYLIPGFQTHIWTPSPVSVCGV